MKCAQNLRFLVDQKPNSLKLLCGLHPPDPCFRDPLSIKPFSYTLMYLSQKYVLTKQVRSCTDISVKSLPGITDKFERKRTTLKSMQNKFAKSYTHV